MYSEDFLKKYNDEYYPNFIKNMNFYLENIKFKNSKNLIRFIFDLIKIMSNMKILFLENKFI